MCVLVHNIDTREINLAGTTLSLESSRGVESYGYSSSGAVVSPGDAESVCFSGGNPPPGYYTLSVHTPDGSTFSTDVRIGSYCSTDANCPDVVDISGDTIYSKDMFCNGGYCDVNTSETYVCSEANASTCDSVVVDGNTYYCEVHGDGYEWTPALIEFTDDLNDNDCDGVVERECSSCQSCTYEMNVVAMSIVSSGQDAVVRLMSDINATDSDLVSTNYYWGASRACVAVEYGADTASNTITFDGGDHTVDVSGGSGIQAYMTSVPITVRNVVVLSNGYGLVADSSSRTVTFQDVNVTSPDLGILVNSYCTVRRANVRCLSDPWATGIWIVGVGGSMQVYDTNVSGDCYKGIDGMFTNNITLSNVRTNIALTGYDYAISPLYHHFSNVYCSNGKEINYATYLSDVNIYVDGNKYCGYIANRAGIDVTIRIFLNGQTVSRFLIGSDGGNIIVYGPGTITDAYTGLYAERYADSFVVDLSMGDVNVCGNLTDLYASTRITCANCGNGYYLRYDTSSGTINCDANCLAPC
ncbi:MAG: hypothetical protein PWP76_47 [Candidatus Diapherotrites archaeon]|nr:hypothetical protein [Candidatus Diapherotrites archaeon]